MGQGNSVLGWNARTARAENDFRLDRAAAALVCAPGVCIRRRARSRSIDPRRVAVIPASRVPIGQFAARFARYRVTKDAVEERGWTWMHGPRP